jgi:cytochrome c
MFIMMKKVFAAIVIAAACYACGGGESTEEKKPVSNNESNSNEQIGGEASTAKADSATVAQVAPAKDGKALIEGSDCRTCHKDAEKLIGPSYAEVAKKYGATDANIKMLTEKIIKGGQGVWGEIPMAAHPNISQEDADAMVKYILSMKK